MKFIQKWIAIFLLVAVAALYSCESGPKFSEVSGKEWLLVEVKTQAETIPFNRKTLVSDGFKNIFTLKFDAERVSGVGAPNNYTAPFTLDKKQAIAIKPMAGTMMAPIREPEKLKEHDYFVYLQNTYKWNLVNGKLELYTKNGSGEEATLVYELGK